MKIYVMVRIEQNNILKPKVGRDLSNLRKEMEAEYDKVLEDAGSLGEGYIMDNNVEKGILNDLVAYYGAIRHEWRIYEIKC